MSYDDIFGTFRHILGYQDDFNDQYCCGFIEISNRLFVVFQEIGAIIYSEIDPVKTFVKYLPFLFYVYLADRKNVQLKSRIISLKKESTPQKDMTINRTIIKKERSYIRKMKKTVASKNSQVILTVLQNKLLKAVSEREKPTQTKNRSVQVDLPSKHDIQGVNRAKTCFLKKAIVLNYISTSSTKIARAKSRAKLKDSPRANTRMNEIVQSSRKKALPDISGVKPSRPRMIGLKSRGEVRKELTASEATTDGASGTIQTHSVDCKRDETMNVLTRNQEVIDSVMKGNKPLFQVRGLMSEKTDQSRPIRFARRTMRSLHSRNSKLISEINYFEFKAPQNPEKYFFGEFYNLYSSKPSHAPNKEHLIKAVSVKLAAMKRVSQKESFLSALNRSTGADFQTPELFCGLDGNRARVSLIRRDMTTTKKNDEWGDAEATRPPLYRRIKDRERLKRYLTILKGLKRPEDLKLEGTLGNRYLNAEFSEIIFPQCSVVSAMGPTVSSNDDGSPRLKPKNEEPPPIDTNWNTSQKPPEISKPKLQPSEVNITADTVKPFKYKISDIFQDRFTHRKPTHIPRRTQPVTKPVSPVAKKIHERIVYHGQGDIEFNKLRKTPLTKIGKSDSFDGFLENGGSFQKTGHEFGADSTQISSSDIKLNNTARRRAEFIRHQTKTLGELKNDTSSSLLKFPRHVRSVNQTTSKPESSISSSTEENSAEN